MPDQPTPDPRASLRPGADQTGGTGQTGQTAGDDEARPASVVTAVRLIWALVALALVVSVLAVVYDDALADVWAGGQGLAADDTRVPPSFAPVVVVLFVVVASLILVLVAFLQGAHNWARHCLAGFVLLIAVATVAGVVAGPPAQFVVCCVLSLVLDAAILVLLYRPETSRFVTLGRG